MAFIASNSEVYVTQWLKTATKGNVLCVKAMFHSRLRFFCTTCDQSLTTTTDAVKSDGTVDYSLQEFVKIHAHVGGHKDPPKPMGGMVRYSEGQYVPLTADFKKIDLKPEKALVLLDAPKPKDKVLAQSTGRKFR